MILTIDTGNTRTKWAIFDVVGSVVAQGALDNAEIETLAEHAAPWSDCRRVAVSCVAGADVRARLQAVLAPVGLPLRWAQATAAACGVRNGYASPEQLGPDRWAALVAAWHRLHAPCIVATAGTALTVDALSADGVFLGGVIVPGLRLMRQSLAAGTALSWTGGALTAYPDNTADAIGSGTWLALAGAVEKMHAQLQRREGRAPCCLLGGGDAPDLQAALSIPAEIADQLVLQGLWLMERERA